MITVGIDEVGRGCWAGPLVAGAAILHAPIPGLRDSKKLSAKQRTVLAAEIQINATVGLGWVWPEEIDTIGLTEAVRLAMQRAVDEISEGYDEIIIDGNINYFPNSSLARALIRADDTVPAVSAASIAAKVARDRYMAEIVATYPGYGFERHVGYGTSEHSAALATKGVTDIHRKSFKPIKAFIK